MSKWEKLKARFLVQPRDFTWPELVKLLAGLGYTLDNKGGTSGSRVEFYGKGLPIISLHKPHPDNTLKRYQMKQVYAVLKEAGLI